MVSIFQWEILWNIFNRWQLSQMFSGPKNFLTLKNCLFFGPNNFLGSKFYFWAQPFLEQKSQGPKLFFWTQVLLTQNCSYISNFFDKPFNQHLLDKIIFGPAFFWNLFWNKTYLTWNFLNQNMKPTPTPRKLKISNF